jgi:hypothetical protein
MGSKWGLQGAVQGANGQAADGEHYSRASEDVSLLWMTSLPSFQGSKEQYIARF